MFTQKKVLGSMDINSRYFGDTEAALESYLGAGREEKSEPPPHTPEVQSGFPTSSYFA